MRDCSAPAAPSLRATTPFIDDPMKKAPATKIQTKIPEV